MKRTIWISVAVAVLMASGAGRGSGKGFAAVPAARPFTIEQALSAPFPTELVAAPAKGRFAWVFNSQGRRNIWVAESSSDGAYKSRQLSSYKDDDGQDLGELNWARDGESIAYTRGGYLENGHAYPNPRSSPEGVEQDVWVVALGGGEPRKLGEGHSPAFSPKGDEVAYIFHDQVWLARSDGSGKPEQLIHAGGESGSLRWRPDGAKLAFVSARGDHSFIGVYDLSAKSLLYLDPSVDLDGEPAWSPEGRQIAYLRIAASHDELPFTPRRAGQPWSIRVADAATGKSHEVWRAAEGRGSVFHEMVAGNQLLWGAGDHIVFP